MPLFEARQQLLEVTFGELSHNGEFCRPDNIAQSQDRTSQDFGGQDFVRV